MLLLLGLDVTVIDVGSILALCISLLPKYRPPVCLRGSQIDDLLLDLSSPLFPLQYRLAVVKGG